MNKSPSTVEIINFIYKLTESHGSRYAYNRLRSYISQMDKNSIPDVLIAASNTLFWATKNQERSEQLLFRQMLAKGISLPTETLFANGFPKREFIVYGNNTEGRQGDQLSKLSYMLNAQSALNIVLCIRSELSKNKSILISNKNNFETDLPSIDQISIYPYLKAIALQNSFKRSLLQGCNRNLFNKLPSFKEYNGLLKDNSLVIHIRGGDALFDGQIPLPPASYYQNIIDSTEVNNVLIVTEPKPVTQQERVNPLPDIIQSHCHKMSIESKIISSKDPLFDAGLIFNANRIVCSNSTFSIYLALFSNSCNTIYIPKLFKESNWIIDTSINYVDCHKKFNAIKWENSLQYRMDWVSYN